MICPNCGHEVPHAQFCVRCGEPLENQDSPYPLEGRGYAAAPNERWFVPRVTSSLFPHLPRADMLAFRIALVLGAVTIITLGALDFFPLALIVAAALVPFLTVLYLWNVDLYEDAPLPMLAFTIVWGLLIGVGLGIAAKHLSSQLSLLEGKANAHNVVWLGFLLPLFSVIGMLVGPLILLPYRRFNDVLDGATFGGACAVTAIGAETITNSADFLHFGLKASGDELLWIPRLLTLGVALPVLAAGAIGSACGSFWLRYRVPAHDRRTRGPLESPFAAVLFSTAAILGANLSVIYLGQWTALVVTVALAAVALVALRRVIHLGLLQEAAEIEIGPPARCPNCGRLTPLHSFCGHCGIAMRALPKHGPPVSTQPPGLTRVRRDVLLALFGALVAVNVGLSVLVITLVKPAATKPLCIVGKQCGQPPHGPPQAAPHAASSASAAPFESGKTWTSDSGVKLRYDSHIWKASNVTNTHIVLRASSHSLYVVAAVIAVPATEGTVQLLDDQLSAEQDGYLGLQRDTVAAHALLGPEIGFAPAAAAVYKASSNQPPSPAERVELTFEVATRGNSTVLIEAVTNEKPEQKGSSPFPAYELIDRLMDSFQWSASA